jgi:glycosyltransferase involved in cell wall biosynthesis
MENLARQTKLPGQVLVGVSEMPTSIVPSFPFPFVLTQSANENDFGYRKRNRLLSLVTEEFVGFFCHDDSYDNDYIERMLEAAKSMEADAVYCSWNQIPNCEFKGCSSTLGNFIVKASILEEIGGFPPCKNEGLRDAELINAIREKASRIARVNIMLYQHNVPYWKDIQPSVWGVIQP